MFVVLLPGDGWTLTGPLPFPIMDEAVALSSKSLAGEDLTAYRHLSYTSYRETGPAEIDLLGKAYWQSVDASQESCARPCQKLMGRLMTLTALALGFPLFLENQ